MNLNEDLEKKLAKQEHAINTLTLQLDNFDREVQEFLNNLDINLDKISTFVENKNNFSEDNWTELLKQRHALEEKLQREIQNIRNPNKIKKAQDSLHVQRHWIHVR